MTVAIIRESRRGTRVYPALTCTWCCGTGISRQHKGTVCACVRAAGPGEVIVGGARVSPREQQEVA